MPFNILCILTWNLETVVSQPSPWNETLLFFAGTRSSILPSLYAVRPLNTFYFNPLSLIPPRDLLWNVRLFPLPAFVLISTPSNFSLFRFPFVFFFFHSPMVLYFAPRILRKSFFTPTMFNLCERERLSKRESSLFLASLCLSLPSSGELLSRLSVKIVALLWQTANSGVFFCP